jgi:hypothetical protein
LTPAKASAILQTYLPSKHSFDRDDFLHFKISSKSSTILLQLLHQREIPTKERETRRFNPSHVSSQTPTI